MTEVSIVFTCVNCDMNTHLLTRLYGKWGPMCVDCIDALTSQDRLDRQNP